MIFKFKQRVFHHKTVSSRDMTQGNPYSLIFRFTVPVLLGNLFQNLYSMTDSIIVGRLLGTNALASVGNTGSLTFLVLGFVFGLTSGFAVITAQAYGSKKENVLKNSVAMNIMLNGISAILFSFLALITTAPILRLINTPAEIFDGSYTYLIIIYSGIPLAILYNATSCILRAVGDSKRPLIFLIVSSLLNIVLDIVFIAFFGWGISGAAWATVIAQGLSGIAGLVTIIHRYPELRVKKANFSWDSGFAARHLKIALPMAFQFSITAIGCIVLQGALNTFGADSIAAFTASGKVEQLIAVGAGSFGVTMANYTGQNFGASDLNRIKKGTTAGTVLTLAFSFLAMLMAFVLPDQLTSLFVSQDAESRETILELSRLYLELSAVFYPALFVIFIYRNVLQAAGKSFMPLMAGVLELFARSICAFVLPGFMGYAGICLAGPVAWVSAAALLCISYFAQRNKLLELK